MAFDLSTAKPVEGFDLSTAQPVEATQSSGPMRFIQGLRDPIDAGAQLLTHILPDSMVNAGNRANNWLAEKTGIVGQLPNGGIDQSLEESEKKYQASRAATGQNGIDWMRMGGNIASPTNIAIGTVAASKIPAGVSMIKRLLTGAGAGAAGGVMNAPMINGDFWTGKAEQAGAGAIGGGAMSGVAAGAARAINPEVRKNISELLKQGITPTPGQILGGLWQKTEDKLTSIPLIGDAIASSRSKGLDEFNQAAYKRALEPISGKTNLTGQAAVADIRQQLGNAYDAILPKLNFKADSKFSADVKKLNGMAASMPDPQAKQFEKIYADKLVSRLSSNGSMDGQTLKGVESELGQLAKGYKSDSSFDNRQLGDAIGELQTALRSNLQRTNPQYANQLKAINEGYANYARIRDAASRQGASEGKFTPAQLSAAVRAQDKTVGKRAFSEGTALMQNLSGPGKEVLAPKYPDSGTAGRLIMGGLTGAGLAGGTAVSPIVGGAALGAASLATLPYLPIGRQLSAALLARRPEGTKAIADAVRKLGPFAAPAFIPSPQAGQ